MLVSWSRYKIIKIDYLYQKAFVNSQHAHTNLKLIFNKDLVLNAESDLFLYTVQQSLKRRLNLFLSTKLSLYIRNLKYAHLTPIFRQHNIHLVSYTCQHKWILCTEKPVLNASFQDFWFTNINNHLFCFEKNDNYIVKG